MFTTKVYHTYYEPPEFVYCIIDENEIEEIRSKPYIDAYDALKDGILHAETLNGSEFDLHTQFPISYMEEVEIDHENIPDDFSGEEYIESVFFETKLVAMSTCRVESKSNADLIDKFYTIYQSINGSLSKDEIEPLFHIFNEFVKDAVGGTPADKIMEIEAEIRNVAYIDVAYDRWVAFMRRIGHTDIEAMTIWDTVSKVITLS